MIGEKTGLSKKEFVVKKRFVAKHLSETFEKIKKGGRRNFIGHIIMHLFDAKKGVISCDRCKKQDCQKKNCSQRKGFVVKYLSETFEKIKKGEEREIIVTWSRASTIIPSMVGHTIMKLLIFSKY